MTRKDDFAQRLLSPPAIGARSRLILSFSLMTTATAAVSPCRGRAGSSSSSISPKRRRCARATGSCSKTAASSRCAPSLSRCSRFCARDPHHLARLAWHLGNRHLPAAIEPDRILIRPDHVIAGMLIGLGAEIAAVEAPFDPEGGAYAQGGHSHSTHHNDHK